MGVTIGLNQAKELLEKGVSEAQDIVKNPGRVDELLIQAETHLKEVPVLGEQLSDIPLMISMIKAYITGSYTNVSPKVIASLVGSLIYVVKKNDLIPDSLPVIGAADDIGVLGLALKLCEPELREFARWRAENDVRSEVPEE